VQWKKSNLDVAELAQKRFIEGWSIKQLSGHFNSPEHSIKSAYRRLRKESFQHPKISAELKANILASFREAAV